MGGQRQLEELRLGAPGEPLSDCRVYQRLTWAQRRPGACHRRDGARPRPVLVAVNRITAFGSPLLHTPHLTQPSSLHRLRDDVAQCEALIQSAACTRATRTRLFEPSGLNTDASPSLLANQSSPNASRMFGLWVTMRVLLPASGATVARALSALARRAFSVGETTSPPSVRSTVLVGDFPLNSSPVSVARLNSLE